MLKNSKRLKKAPKRSLNGKKITLSIKLAARSDDDKPSKEPITSTARTISFTHLAEDTKTPGTSSGGFNAADIKKRVSAHIQEFEASHEKSVSVPHKVSKNDQSLRLGVIKNEIKGNIKDSDKTITQKTKGIQDYKIQTGVHGLDEILGGGLIKNSLILLSGTCGTGKSIFGMDFLMKGATQGEPGVYISIEESPEGNIQQMKMLGWPVDDMIKKKKLLILQPELYNFDALLTTIEDSVDRIKAKRLVIDSVSIIGMYFEDPYKVRKSLLQLNQLLKKLNCTTIAIDEIKECKEDLSAYGVEEFVADGVVILYLIKKGNIFLRAITIRKMRGVNHSPKIHPMEIRSPEGIVIYPSQELFEDIS